MTRSPTALERIEAGEPSADGRQSPQALDICRGVLRLLALHGMVGLTEVTLASGRRADVVALGTAGEIWIIEIKSSLDDFRTDQKWPEYREFCDRLSFAVAPGFPCDVVPETTGLIVADRYGGEIMRAAPEHRLAGARRKALTLRFARLAAARLTGVIDPAAALDPAPRT